MPAAMGWEDEQSGGRRVLAGIDEAGFGPLLGPLVIGATAWRVPGDCDGGDLWQRLRGGVSRLPSRRLTRLAINDSKKIYSSGRGLAELERGVLGSYSTMASGGGRADDGQERSAVAAVPDALGRFLDRLAPGWAEQAGDHPWYEGAAELALPVESEPADLATRANGLRVAMRRGQVEFLGPGLELVLEGRYNRLCEAIGNKSRVLFCCTARLIQRLLDRFGREPLTVICDKHGGRDSYRALLMQHWPGMHLSVLAEGHQRSGYRLDEGGPDGRIMELWFVVAADRGHLPVSLASMYCKYTRELFMRLLNRFWQDHVGKELRATAGYCGDGRRFVREVAETAGRIGLPADRFVRQR